MYLDDVSAALLFGSGAIGSAGDSESQGCWFDPSLPNQINTINGA